MDILSTLENLDSKAEKAKAGIFRWVLPLALGSIAAVALSWGFRSWRESRTNHAWDTFRMHLWARRGSVAVIGDSAVASEQVRSATGVAWGDLASAIQSGNLFEPDKGLMALTVVRGSPESTASAVSSLALLGDGGKDGLESLASKLARTSEWLGGRPQLTGNVIPEGAPSYAVRIDEGVLEISLDPSIGSDLLAELQRAVQSGVLDGSQMTPLPSRQAFQLVPSSDAISKFDHLHDLLSKLAGAPSGLALFKGTVAVGRQGQATEPHSIHIFTLDSLFLRRNFTPIGIVRKGGELISVGQQIPQDRVGLRVISVSSI